MRLRRFKKNIRINIVLKPTKPTKTITNTEEEIYDEYMICLDDVGKYIRTDCGYNNVDIYLVNPNELPNPNYEKQIKQYEKDMKEYQASKVKQKNNEIEQLKKLAKKYPEILK